MIPGFPQFPTFPSNTCAELAPAVRRYISDTWSFPYTFLQPKLDANGNAILDAKGNPVPDPTNPVNLTGSTMSAELYVAFSSAPFMVLGTSTDGDTNLLLGKFKIVVPDNVTKQLRPDPQFTEQHATRIAVIQTDSLGNDTTLAVQHIAVVAR